MYKGLLNTPPSKLRAPPLSLQYCLKLLHYRNLPVKRQKLPTYSEWPHLHIARAGGSVWMLSSKWRHKGATEGRVPEPRQPIRVSLSPHPHLSPSGLPTGEVTSLIQSRKPGVPCFCFQLVHFLRGLSTFTCAFVHSFTPSFIRHLLSLFWAPFWALSVQNTFDCFIKSFPSCESCQLSGGIVTQWNWHMQRTQITWVQPCLNAPFTRLQIPLDSRSSWTHLFLTPPRHHTCISSTQRW